MASYNDINCPAAAWTAIPPVAEDTIISSVNADVRLSSNPNGVGGSGIPFEGGSAHIIRANTELWVTPAGKVSATLARMTA